MDTLKALFEAILNIDPWLLIPILLISAYVENLFPPMPGDTVTVLAAYLVGRGRLDFVSVIMATVIGSTAGFMTIYYLAYTKGRSFFSAHRHPVLERRLLSPKNVARVQRWIDKYGDRVLLMNRFLAGMRSTVALLAGLAGMRPRRVAFFSFLSIVLWNSVLIYAGMAVGANWEALVHIIKAYSWIVSIALLLIVGIAGMLLHRRWRHLPASAQPDGTQNTCIHHEHRRTDKRQLG